MAKEEKKKERKSVTLKERENLFDQLIKKKKKESNKIRKFAPLYCSL